ncbi:18858_t:CDS:1 [Funneliformis geosporum]|uniref:2682_t:CDS:1 n=1 Tax=Funneliformis geosporum TaxID=1117311 RepID=A0A9W4SE43_9GLOM|nr:2682_t:CDS:1 [Funneliformis geosporum]CAI2171597.1 18858_t:CDS:1 [Funneliformis geosporum]
MHNVKAHPYNNPSYPYDTYFPNIPNAQHQRIPNSYQEIDLMVESFVRNNYAPTILPIKTLISPKAKPRRSNIPRPLNSFLIYRRDYQARLSKEAGRILPKVSQEAGALWKSEKDEVRNLYEKIADLAGEVHKLLFPNYEYRPNKSKRKRSAKPEMTDKDIGATPINLPLPNLQVSQVPLVISSFDEIDRNMCRVFKGPS